MKTLEVIQDIFPEFRILFFILRVFVNVLCSKINFAHASLAHIQLNPTPDPIYRRLQTLPVKVKQQ